MCQAPRGAWRLPPRINARCDRKISLISKAYSVLWQDRNAAMKTALLAQSAYDIARSHYQKAIALNHEGRTPSLSHSTRDWGSYEHQSENQHPGDAGRQHGGAGDADRPQRRPRRRSAGEPASA